jgi:hypothetical protein
MNKTTIRMFIRESLRSRVRLDEVRDDALAGPIRGNIPDNFKDFSMTDAAKKSFVGKRFSSIADGAPEITIVADNPSTSQVVFIPYPIADTSTDREGSDYTTTESVLMKRFNAQMMPNDADIINQIFNNAAGWTSLNGIYPVLTPFFDSAKRRRLDFVPNVLMASRTPALLKKPASYSTRSAPKRAEEFECILPIEEVVSITFGGRMGFSGTKVPVTNPRWALAAACYYGYANSAKGAILAGLVGAVAGGILLSETGPFAVAGAIVGAGLASTSSDIVLRLPVIFWAYETKRYRFLSFNMTYIVILLLFESLVHFKELKGLYQAGKVVGVENLAKGGNRFYTYVMNKLAPTGALETSDEVLRKSILGLTRWRSSTGFFTDSDIDLAVKAARNLDFWTPTKLVITGFVLQGITWFFGADTAAQCKNDVMSILETGDFTPERLSESKEFREYIANRIPEI